MKSLAFVFFILFSASASAFAQDKAPEATKPCFACFGTGKAKCKVIGCKNGEADCPAPCLKLSKGNWIRKNVPGHDPKELWQEFRGRTTRKAWSQAHVGEVIQMQSGEPTNIGQCKTCSGTTRAKCGACRGTGQTVCDLCVGNKVVPAAWTEFDNPKMKNPPKDIRLKDGRTIRGRIISSLGDTKVIKTAEGGRIEVKSSDVLE